MANGWGGKREGSGRPPNSVRFAKIREATEKELERIAREHASKSIEQLVIGVYREEKDHDGNTIRIYQEKPSIAAIQEVLNRLMGKPVSALELSGPDGGPLDLVSLIQKAAQGG